MKLKTNFFYTLRENAKDEDSTSGNLLVRSGMIKKIGAGIYMFMPLGLRTFNNIKNIIKEEMDNAGAQELLMPSLIPEEYYEVCGRVASLGSSMFHLQDRYSKPYVLGPTHEELFTVAAKNMVRSYKDLPFTVYQQAPKYRDEPRPRYGLIRVREFTMKDAYSFDKDEEGLDISYHKMFDAYKKIFDRIGLNYAIVKADTGVMGGSLSEEFQAITDIGEDTVVLCNKCDYSSNIEVSKHIPDEPIKEELKEKELVETPHMQTIEEVTKFLNIDIKKTVKALLMNIDGKLTIFFVRGDRTLNETKVTKLLKCNEINFADDALISTSNACPGFTGPINLTVAQIIIDEEVLNMTNFVVGANKEGYHYMNANINDFTYDISADIVNVEEGDTCPVCGGKLYFKKGIEVGNTFKLGTKYSEALNLRYVDKDNTLKPVVMGSYGIGVARCMSAIVEQSNDEDGIIWPINIAPYKVSIVIINNKDEEQVNVANSLYDYFNKNNVSCLLDDRDERAGIKFKDMDLIGIPYRIVVGKKVNEGIVEVKDRKTKEIKEILVKDILNYFN